MEGQLKRMEKEGSEVICRQVLTVKNWEAMVMSTEREVPSSKVTLPLSSTLGSAG